MRSTFVFLLLSVSLHLTFAQSGGRPLLSFLQGRLAGGDDEIASLVQFKAVMSSMLDQCYNMNALKQAMSDCNPTDGPDFRQILKDGSLSTEERAEIVNKIKNTMENMDYVCVYEKLGVIENGAMTVRGVESSLRLAVADPKLTEKVVDIGKECLKIVSGCSIGSLAEQARIQHSCIRAKMIPLCLRSHVEEKLGFDPEFDY